MLNYYIYITFIGLRVDGTSKVTLIYMGVYLLLIAAIFFILWIQKISFFNSAWVKDFFHHEDAKVRYNRTIIFLSLIVLTFIIVLGIYLSLGIIQETERAVFYLGLEFFFSFTYIIVSFAMLKILVEYSILSDVTAQEKQHQAELESFIKMIRAQRHDFNLHVHAINGLIDAQKYTECKEYVAKMVAETE